MRTSFLSFDEMDNYLGKVDSIHNNAETNSDMLKRSKITLRRAINNGLTQRQRDCIEKHYFENKSLLEIGDELGIDKSTVSRHIKAAKRRIEKVMSISCF